jgi:hypothetical protein
MKARRPERPVSRPSLTMLLMRLFSMADGDLITRAEARNQREEHMTTKPKTRKAPAAKTRGANVVPFPKAIDPMHRQVVKYAEQAAAEIQSIGMRSIRRQLAEAEVKAALGDPDAKDDADFFRLLLKRAIRDHDWKRSKMIQALLG